MTEIESKKFIETLDADDNFVKKVAKAKEPKLMMEVFAEIGIILSEEDAEEIIKLATEKAENGELTEEDMDDVSGGMSYLAACAACGGVWGVGLGLAAVGVYYVWKKTR